jgi:hypothetical protein
MVPALRFAVALFGLFLALALARPALEAGTTPAVMRSIPCTQPPPLPTPVPDLPVPSLCPLHSAVGSNPGLAGPPETPEETSALGGSAQGSDRAKKLPSRPAGHRSPTGHFPWLEVALILAFLLTVRKIARLS